MKKLLFITLIFAKSIAFSQIPEITWQFCFGTYDAMNYTSAIEKTPLGYFTCNAVPAWEEGVPENFHGGQDIWLYHLDSLGQPLWSTCIGGSNGESVIKIININDSEFYLFGYSNSEDGDIQGDCGELGDLLVAKMDLSGNVIWSQCYGSPYPDEKRDAVLTPDGGLVIMGRVTADGDDVSEYYGSYDVWLCKIDQWGTIEWEKTYGNYETDNGIDLILTSDNTLMFIGANQDNGGMIDCYHYGYSYDVWLVEASLENGEIIRQECYGGSHGELGFNILELEEGYIFIASTDSNDGDISGFHGPPGEYNDDIWLVRLDEDLNIIWQKCLGGYDTEYPNYLNLTYDGGYIIFGITMSNDGDVSGNHGGYSDIWVVKTDSLGEIQWQHCYGGENRETLWSINSVLKKSDHVYVLAAMAVENSYDVDCDIDETWQFDSWIFEINDTTTQIINEQVIHQLSISAKPNPASDFVIFEMDQTNIGGTIQIFNVVGVQIASINILDRTTVWNCQNVNDGIYFYTYALNGYSKAGKLIVSH